MMSRLSIPVKVSLLSMCLVMGASYPAAPVYAQSKVVKSSSMKKKTQTDRFAIQASKILANTSGLDRQVLELALVAHGNAKRMNQTNKDLLTVVDYSLPSTTKRFWVINLQTNEIVFHDYVAHGVNSGDRYTTAFSNESGSRASSYGVFLTSNTYYGQHGYSLRLDGLEKKINGNARARAIVMHGGSYVSTAAIKMIGRLGRSWGCFTLRSHLTEPVINKIQNKTVIFAYYPNFNWLATSSYLNKKALI